MARDALRRAGSAAHRPPRAAARAGRDRRRARVHALGRRARCRPSGRSADCTALRLLERDLAPTATLPHRGPRLSTGAERRTAGVATAWRAADRAGSLDFRRCRPAAGRVGRGKRAPHRLASAGRARRGIAAQRADRRGAGAGRPRSSTASGSSRSTSPSPAARCSRSPPTARASPSTRHPPTSARRLVLPPWLEPRRAAIEAGLPPLRLPGAAVPS